jgi:heat shock protein HtpX
MSIFVIFVTLFGLIIGFSVGETAAEGYIWAGGAFLFALLSAWVSYYTSDKLVLAISGAKEVKKKDAPELYRLVENIAITSGLPTPKVYIIEDTAPNAFATGRDPKHAVIAFTTGILQKLSKVELEGVVAHEMSHIGNFDIRLMMIVATLVGMVALLSDWFLRWTWFHPRHRSDENRQDQLGAILAIIALILALLSPIIATLMQLAISRKREYLADASAAMLTRNPEGLASALIKISQDKEPLEVANKATAHLYICNPLKDKEGKGGAGWFANLFNTHPPIEERVKRLREMVGKI